MAIRRTIETVFSVLKYYGIENILARSVDSFQQIVEIIVLTYLNFPLTEVGLYLENSNKKAQGLCSLDIIQLQHHQYQTKSLCYV